MTANEAEQSKGWGPTTRHAAANVLRLRKARGLSTTRLAAALKQSGHPIPATGITRIEKGERRIDVDDLVALATVLEVSPTALLLPTLGDGSEPCQLTDSVSVPAAAAWEWADGQAPLRRSEEDPQGNLLRFRLDSRPAWDRDPIRKMYNSVLTESSKRTALANNTGKWSKEDDGSWVLRTPDGDEIWRGPAPE